MDDKRKLIWKYFWKRKRAEVKEFFRENGSFFFIVQIISFVLLSIIFGLPLEDGVEPINLSLSIIFLSIVVIELTILILWSIINPLIKWLRSNWKLATKDAIRELK